MKFFYQATLSYKGSQYSGYQFQKPEDQTIQKEIEIALKKVFASNEIQVIAASRTDTNVHALGQKLKVMTPKDLSPELLKKYLNTKLPDDIKIQTLDICADNYSPQLKSVKTYHYYFSDKTPNPLLSDIVYFHHLPLDVELMQKACSIFRGEHDFKNFCTLGSRTPNTIRDLSQCEIRKVNFGLMETEIYVLSVQANGFLKYMVRFIMGALLGIGEKKYSTSQVENEFLNNQLMIKKAAAHGLTLAEIQV